MQGSPDPAAAVLIAEAPAGNAEADANLSPVKQFSADSLAPQPEGWEGPAPTVEHAVAATKSPSRPSSGRVWTDEALENAPNNVAVAPACQSPVQQFDEGESTPQPGVGPWPLLVPQPAAAVVQSASRQASLNLWAQNLLTGLADGAGGGADGGANGGNGAGDAERALTAIMQELGVQAKGTPPESLLTGTSVPFAPGQMISTEVQDGNVRFNEALNSVRSFTPAEVSRNNSVRTSSSSFEMLARASASFRRAPAVLVGGVLTFVGGDDHHVEDKWDAQADASNKGKAPSLQLNGMEIGSGSMVAPETPARNTHRTKSGYPYADLVNEKRSGRLLMWNHLQTLMFSFFVSAVCIPLVGLVSIAHWSFRRTPEEVEALTIATGVQQSVFVPNGGALQVLLLLQLVFPLACYSLLLYVCVTRQLRIPRGLLAFVFCSVAGACIICGLFYHFMVPFWFYYLDIIIIVVVYVPCMCVAGWYIESDPDAPWKTRLNDLIFIGILETLVAGSAMLYCMFLMPIFFQITSSWGQLAWLCILHPLYFEITNGYIIRKALFRNIKLGRTHVVYFLTIVHALVHSVALATTLQASLEPLKIMAVTVVLYQLSKFIWRSTIIPRDLFIERLQRGWSFNFPEDERAELGRMVAVTVLTEMVLDNASAIITPFMLYRMFEEPIFMAVVPDTFFNANGKASPGFVLVLIVILLSFTIIFDVTFLFTNYYMWQRLPLINTWRRIKSAQKWYLFFLTYAFATMGIFFLFLMMLLLPRATFCKSNNYCDCTLLAYQTACQGEYISLLSDYLVNIN